ncbi:MAG TPA: SDR family NAD(P)-dependent oxidoreductase [Planctomycetota bacterium]|nr:SDR family NAD(P)-dependent oxidoreductase [Planctomycetota bacterium]
MSTQQGKQPFCSLHGRTALVSGGSGGIGRAVVATLQHAGAEVYSIDRVGTVAPPGAVHLQCDLADAAAIAALHDHLPANLHAFVHCAGITRDGVLWKLAPEAWSEVLRVNLDSAFHLLRVVVPRLRATGGGSIVLLASINGERGKFGQCNYAASKAGLIALGKSAARELGSFGIRVNSVAPGWIETDMTKSLTVEQKRAALTETALGKLGRPEDVAGAVLFLCSDLSGHVSGQVLRVDGGQCTA